MNDRYRNDYDEDYGSISFGDERDRENARHRAYNQGRTVISNQSREYGRGRERDFGEHARGREGNFGEDSFRQGRGGYGFEENRYAQGHEGSYPRRSYGQGGQGQGSYGQGSYGQGSQREEDSLRGFNPWRSSNERGGLGWSRANSPAYRREGGFQGKGPKGYTRSDERIREDVSDRLTDDDEVDASEITVTVKDGEVTLEGFVADRRAKHRAEDIADAVTGVKDVHNGLKTRKGFLQEMGDRLTGRDETEQHGHSGAGPRNGPAMSAGSPAAARHQ